MTVKGTQARAGAKVPPHGSLPHLPPKAIIANPKRQQIWLPSFFCISLQNFTELPLPLVLIQDFEPSEPIVVCKFLPLFRGNYPEIR